MAEKNLSVLFNTLEQARKTKIVENKFKVHELTLEQQRDLLGTVFSPAESPARLALAFNKIINDCVEVIEPSALPITTIDRSLLLREIRDLSIGTEFVKGKLSDSEEEKQKYKFTKVSYSKINKLPQADSFTINGQINVNLKVPSLKRSTEVNKSLLNAIDISKRKAQKQNKELDRGEITSNYLLYELIQYIDTITFGELSYEFEKMLIGEQLRFIDSIPQENLENITNFIEKVKEVDKLVFTAKNLETNEEEVIGLEFNIFSKDLSS